MNRDAKSRATALAKVLLKSWKLPVRRIRSGMRAIEPVLGETKRQ